MELNYIKLTDPQDPDIPYLLAQYQLPQVARFISIDRDRYFSYVTGSEDVAFYKVYLGDALAATTHLEWSGTTLYLDIVVFPEHQRRGIGTAVIADIQAGVLAKGAERIEISIDEANLPSRRLFEKLGFRQGARDGELIDYVYVFGTRKADGSPA